MSMHFAAAATEKHHAALAVVVVVTVFVLWPRPTYSPLRVWRRRARLSYRASWWWWKEIRMVKTTTIFDGWSGSWSLERDGFEAARLEVADAYPHEVSSAIDGVFPAVEKLVEASCHGGGEARALVFDHRSSHGNDVRSLLAPYADPEVLEEVFADRVAIVSCRCAPRLGLVRTKDRRTWVAFPNAQKGDCLLTKTWDNKEGSVQVVNGTLLEEERENEVHDHDRAGHENDQTNDGERREIRAVVLFHPRARRDLGEAKPFIAPHINRIFLQS